MGNNCCKLKVDLFDHTDHNLSSVKIPTLKLNNGIEIPIIGLGTWKSTPNEVLEAVTDAIDLGYRHIDGAMVYENESEVGAAIKAKIDEEFVKREDLFITSKLWNTFHRADLVIPALKQTLFDLGTDYLDLYLMHLPLAFKECTPSVQIPQTDLFPKDENGKNIYSDVDYLETWAAMEKCVILGWTKSIGVSNFNSKQIERLLSVCKIKPAMVQIECHPYLNQRKLTEYCKSKGIAVTAFSPFGSPDRPWAKSEDSKILENPKLIEIGKKYDKSAAQVVLRWLIQRDMITIPKSIHENRLSENINIFDFTLSDEDMDQIYSLDCNGRVLLMEWYANHKYYPFNIEF